jgi:membrane associated rhomboid family serine protease
MDNTFGPPEHNSSYHDSRPKPPAKDHYTDPIPLKPSNKIDTSSQDLHTQNAQYPPSPEVQTSSELLPKRRKKKKGFFSGRIAWVVYTTTLVQITVFIVEIIKNSMITGSPIMIHPRFNPMIGPSTYVQINMGARFVPCMRTDPQIQGANPPITWPCPNVTSSNLNDSSYDCDLSALCGFGGLDDQNPNQWFRFIVPMFLHAGLIHIAFNMLLQLTMGREMEQAIGSVRFALVYFSSGIFGFVLGGNLAAKAIASTGASGCLFGVLALVLLDLIYHWNERLSPVKDLMWILVDVVVSFVLGLLPGLDNFSHIGGFLMGLVLGICILHSPSILRQRTGGDSLMPYRNVGSDPDLAATKLGKSTETAKAADVSAFAKQPVGFFKGRKPLWWAWWLLRAGALIGVLVGFVVLINNFYKYRDTCSWCKYLSCLPINGWCELGNLQLKNKNTTQNTHDKRHLAGVLVGELLDRAGMA